MKRLVLLAAMVAAFAVTAIPASAATVVNGSFESGLSGWNVADLPSSDGTWSTYTGTTPAVSADSNPFVPAAFGNSAMADMNGETSTVLTQDVALEPGLKHTLNLKYWYLNLASWAFPDPASYAFDAGENQQVVLDVIKGGTDGFSADADSVLATVFRPTGDSPSSIDWQQASVDLTAFAGQTVRLRFLDVNNRGYLLLGVDDVEIASVDATAPTLGPVKFGKSKITTTGKGAGTTFSFDATEAGTLAVTFAKSTKGKKSGKKCVKPSKKLAKKKNCTRWVPVKGSLSLAVAAGANKLVFSGKVGKRALAPGKYRVSFVLSDAAGNAAPAVTKTITVAKPKKKKKKK